MASKVTKGLKGLVCGLFVSTLGYAAVYLPQQPANSKAAGQAVDFVRDIQPIFQQACYQCHGPKKAMGQLRLDDKKLALKGGISGPVIIPGKGQESRLVQRLLGLGNEPRMPMGGDPLAPAQIDLVRAWIDQGAIWPGEEQDQGPKVAKHWAYIKPTRPAPPAVKNAGWVRNPIDNFILARLEKEGLAASPEADKATLLRRVYLDLTGLPPSVKEVDDFLADKSADAYEKVVDRLLASPHYGERWTRPWLDLARYADTNGYEKDQPRTMWKYRDWVIKALNQDLPLDRFTVEQIAGDMLPNATTEQKIATGFHRNTMFNDEGGIDPGEARFEVMVDRVNTTAAVWLGSTLGCAQCHNHKYDPFTQKEYYKFLAFFDSADYTVRGADHTERFVEPQLDLPTPEQAAKRGKLQKEIDGLEAQLKTQTPALDAAQAEWEQGMRAEPSQWTVLDPLEFKSTGGTTLTKLADKSILASGANPEVDTYVVVVQSKLTGITAIRLEALTDPSLPKGGPGRDPYGHFLLTSVEAEVAPLDHPSSAQPIVFSNAGVDDAAFKFEAKGFLKAEVQTAVMDRPKGWTINATRDAVRVPRQLVLTPDKPIGFEQGTVLTIKLAHLGGALGQGLGRFRLSVTTGDDPLRVVGISAVLRPALEIPPEKRTEKQKNDLAAQFRAATPLLKPARERLAKLRDELKELGVVSTLVMAERPSFERPFTYLRERGSYLTRGEKVYAAVPAVLHPMPESQPFNRLGLAHWLVDESNPLVARVTVNRFWEQLFGRGMVETSEDFGSQGQPPSHPELLDWLATEFVRQKWSIKSIHRLIVTSATYRQASAVTPALLERDPYNRLLARGPRFRMEAEMVRDIALAASGLLSRKVGGPSVYPPQPEGIWRNPYSDAKWATSKGEDRYRRSLYTFLRRTSPYPAFMTFDATSREFCTVRRVRTNTPLQALTTLNDEAFFEAARSLAERVVAEAGEDARSRVIYGFRLCVSRQPKAEELDRLVALYTQQVRHFSQHAPAAEQVIKGQVDSSLKTSVPELAAWTVVANVLLNLDETLTKE